MSEASSSSSSTRRSHLSSQWLQSFPFVTAVWFYSVLVVMLSFHLYHSSLGASSAALLSSTFPFERLLLTSATSFGPISSCILSLFIVPHAPLLNIWSLLMIGWVARQDEEEHYSNAVGAVRVLMRRLIAVLTLFVLRQSGVESLQRMMSIAFVHCAVTHYSLHKPFSPVKDSQVFKMWMLPFVLLLFLSFIDPSAFSPAFIGIFVSYGMQKALVTLPNVFSESLLAPQPLVRAFESLQIGRPQIFRTHRGHTLRDS